MFKDPVFSKKKKLPFTLKWSLIAQLGSMRFSKSSYYFLTVIPILVKVFDDIKSPVTFLINNTYYKVNVDLPFSWYLFFAGSLFIAIGTTIYRIVCPELIRRYKNYSEFASSGQSDSYLTGVSLFNPLGPTYLEEKAIKKRKTSHMGYFVELTPQQEEYEAVVGHQPNLQYLESRKNYFNEFYSKLEISKPKWLIGAFVSYMIGFGFFIWVIFQNIVYVGAHLLDNHIF